jgi:hypothetical protein
LLQTTVSNYRKHRGLPRTNPGQQGRSLADEFAQENLPAEQGAANSETCGAAAANAANTQPAPRGEAPVANNDGAIDNGLPFYATLVENLVATNSLFNKVNVHSNQANACLHGFALVKRAIM